MMRMAGDLTGYVDQMADFLNQDADFAEMIHHFDELMQGPITQESVDEMNAMIPMINEFILRLEKRRAARCLAIPPRRKPRRRREAKSISSAAN